MYVKWHNHVSHKEHLNGGGPQGSILGNFEYLAQSNDNADCVKCDDRFKFVDDLTVLEKINLLVIGLASHNPHSQIPNDILSNNQIIPAENLETQKIINHIQQWTEDKRMILNEKKNQGHGV